MAVIHDLEKVRTQLRGGGEPPDNAGMEERIAKLEDGAQDARERLIRIEVKQDHLATKADLAEAKYKIIVWVVGAVLFTQLVPAMLKKFGL